MILKYLMSNMDTKFAFKIEEKESSFRERFKDFQLDGLRWGLKITERIAKKFNRKETPVSQSSNQQKDFEEWTSTNKEFLVAKIKSGKRGYKTVLYKLASNQIEIPQSTFFRLLKLHL